MNSNEYHKYHRVCPACGGKDEKGNERGLEVTLLGIIKGDDTNRASCACGWQGTGHDLVPEKSCETCDLFGVRSKETERSDIIISYCWEIEGEDCDYDKNWKLKEGIDLKEGMG